MIGVAAVPDKWVWAPAHGRTPLATGLPGDRTMPTQGVWSYLSLTRRAKRKNVWEFVMFTDILGRMLLRRLVAGKAAADSVFGAAAVGVFGGHSYALRSAAGWGHPPFLALYVAGSHYVLRPLGVCGNCAALHLTPDERSRVGQAATGGPRPRRAVCTNLPGAAQSAGVARKDHHYRHVASVVSTKW